MAELTRDDELDRQTKGLVDDFKRAGPPFERPEGNDYAAYCELYACTACDGIGEDWIEDEWDEEAQAYGKAWVCRRCGGTGAEPTGEE